MYFAPYVDETGLHYPTYNEVLTSLVEDMRSIYGDDIYLGSDSQDYELLSKFAEKIYDTYQAMEIAYNAHSPAKAIGNGLDYIVALNGITRKQGTRSVAMVNITGTAGTTINNGKIADTYGVLWDLPETVTIGEYGTVSAVATCEVVGNVQAQADTIIRIMTPTLGWLSVTNPSAAVMGMITEPDSKLRERQATSVASPSQSILEGLKGAVLTLDEVERCEVIENNSSTGSTIPAHSICCIVQGGDSEEIARTILNHKSAGCGTYGNTSETVTDAYGHDNTVSFSRPSVVDVDVEITISRKAGYSSSYVEKIKTAIATYLNGFEIGADLTTSILGVISQQVIVDYANPDFVVMGVKACRHGGALGTADVLFDYDEVASGNINYINVVAV